MDPLRQAVLGNILEELAADREFATRQAHARLTVLSNGVQVLAEQAGNVMRIAGRRDGGHGARFRHGGGGGQHRCAAQAVADQQLRRGILGAQEIDVSVNEFEVLWLLVSRAGEVVSRGELIAQLRGFDYDGFDRSMDIRISRLRKKLEGQSLQGATIKTVRGKGYLYSTQGR